MADVFCIRSRSRRYSTSSAENDKARKEHVDRIRSAIRQAQASPVMGDQATLTAVEATLEALGIRPRRAPIQVPITHPLMQTLQASVDRLELEAQEEALRCLEAQQKRELITRMLKDLRDCSSPDAVVNFLDESILAVGGSA